MPLCISNKIQPWIKEQSLSRLSLSFSLFDCLEVVGVSNCEFDVCLLWHVVVVNVDVFGIVDVMLCHHVFVVVVVVVVVDVVTVFTLFVFLLFY